ncbi:MAG: hypothetical protein LIO57_08320 [Oscillospiraceae bacterium]|nr:hypothetical protein [Oscillospiraceae bacterium]
MATPNTSELLVQQARELEQLRLLVLVRECKTLEELEQKLKAALNM